MLTTALISTLCGMKHNPTDEISKIIFSIKYGLHGSSLIWVLGPVQSVNYTQPTVTGFPHSCNRVLWQEVISNYYMHSKNKMAVQHVFAGSSTSGNINVNVTVQVLAPPPYITCLYSA